MAKYGSWPAIIALAEFVKLFELVDYVFVWIGLLSILFELVDYVFVWIGLISILFELVDYLFGWTGLLSILFALVELHEWVEKFKYFNCLIR